MGMKRSDGGRKIASDRGRSLKLFVQCKVRPAPVSLAWIKRLAGETLRGAKGRAFEGRSELSVVLTGDGEVRGLNRDYRGKDKVTDVLSFPLLEGKRLKTTPGRRLVLGDVVISVPRARRQAQERGASLKEELALLLVHGTLHLLGYDHATRSQEKRMFSLQAGILGKFHRPGSKAAKNVKR